MKDLVTGLRLELKDSRRYEDINGGHELNKVVKGAGITFFGKAYEGGITFLYSLILARLLGAEGFGLLFLGFAIINILSLLIRFGFETGVTRYVALYHGEKDKARVKGVILQSIMIPFAASIILSLCLFFLSDIIATVFFGKPELSYTIRWLSISFPFFILMTIILFATQGFQSMRYSVYVQSIFQPTISLFLGLIFFKAGLGLNGILLGYIISIICSSVFSFYFLRLIFPEITDDTRPIFETKKLIGFSIILYLVLVLNFAIVQIDTIILGHFRSSFEVGIYSGVSRIANVINLVFISFVPIFNPIIYDLYNKKEIVKLEAIFKTVTKWMFAITLPIFLFISIFAKEVMGIMGKEFSAGAGSLVVLLFAFLINASTGPIYSMLTMSGKQRLLVLNSVIVFAIDIALNIILVPIYGFRGTALSTGISIVLANIIALAQVYFLVGIHPYNISYYKFFCGSIFAGVILFFLKMGTIISYKSVFYIFIYSLVYLGCYLGILMIFRFDREDRIIFDHIKKVFSLKFRLTG